MTKLLCKIGFHKWTKPKMSIYGASSNVMSYKQYCKKCSKTKKWTEPRPPSRYN